MSDSVSPLPVDKRLELDQVTRSEFVNALIHLYRGELGEATAWRGRIDTTSHWAIVMSATTLSFVFSDKAIERHVLIPIITLFCTFLLTMEARRYRFYDIWRSRARMIEINFYGPLLSGTKPATPDWADRLGQDMEWPRFHMPWWEAMGRRLRRNYVGIYSVLLGSWFVVLTTHPGPSTSLTEIISRASIGPVPGLVIFIGMMIAILFPTIVTATIGFLIVGFGVSSIIPLMFSTAGKVKEVASGIAIATVSGIGFFGFLMGPPLIGYIAQLAGLQYSFAVIAVLGLGITLLINRIKEIA